MRRPAARPTTMVTTAVASAAARAGHAIRPPSTGRTSTSTASAATQCRGDADDDDRVHRGKRYGAPPRRVAETTPRVDGSSAYALASART